MHGMKVSPVAKSRSNRAYLHMNSSTLALSRATAGKPMARGIGLGHRIGVTRTVPATAAIVRATKAKGAPISSPIPTNCLTGFGLPTENRVVLAVVMTFQARIGTPTTKPGNGQKRALHGSTDKRHKTDPP